MNRRDTATAGAEAGANIINYVGKKDIERNTHKDT